MLDGSCHLGASQTEMIKEMEGLAYAGSLLIFYFHHTIQSAPTDAKYEDLRSKRHIMNYINWTVAKISPSILKTST